ncbi:MAG: hypothetical protein H6922_05090 [Pseudomonadaceae bacterium]|nr:hypothetical protein [Pseudomonadaceae bacterium]
MAGPTLPHRPPPRSSAVPLLPLLIALVLVVLALQGVKLLYTMGFLGDIPAPEQTIADPFQNLPVVQHGKLPTPVVARAPAFRHNLVTGAPTAAYTLTIFTDPACGPCRDKLARWLTPVVTGNARIIYKYWPATVGDINGGLVMELARRQNLAGPLLSQLQTTAGTLSAEAMFNALEAAGLPLPQQRRLFAAQSEELAALVGKDIDQGRTLRLGPPPQLILQDRLLDGRLLSPSRLDLYIGRLGRNQPLVQPTDIWLFGGDR